MNSSDLLAIQYEEMISITFGTHTNNGIPKFKIVTKITSLKTRYNKLLSPLPQRGRKVREGRGVGGMVS